MARISKTLQPWADAVYTAVNTSGNKDNGYKLRDIAATVTRNLTVAVKVALRENVQGCHNVSDNEQVRQEIRVCLEQAGFTVKNTRSSTFYYGGGLVTEPGVTFYFDLKNS